MGHHEFVPALRINALTRFYDPIVRITTREGLFKRLLLEQASPRAGERILDLGCGTGTLAISIQDSTPTVEVHGLDADTEILARAREKARASGLSKVQFQQGFSDELPYQDKSFDKVVSTLFFHHLNTAVKRDTVAEINRVLRPAGQLHIADWGKPSDPAMHAFSLSICLLDGFEPTRDNLNGQLPEILEQEGLTDSRQTGQIRTAFGTLALYSASKPGAAT